MARELTPTDHHPLAAHLTIRTEQADAVRRLITHQPAEHQPTYLAVLGLDDVHDQP